MRDPAIITVVGSGTMGRGIAQVAATSGFGVRLHDASRPALEAAVASIRAGMDKAVDKGKLEPPARDAALSRLEASPELAEAVRGADVVVEAVPENLDLKRTLFRTIEAWVPAHAVLASNTSSLSIAAIAGALADPSRAIGMHFFNPVPLMPLLEIVRGSATSDRTLEVARETGRRLGKETIVVNDSPGFATSRLGVLLGLEAIRMVEQGVASAEDIDKAMTLGYRHPMGPLRLTDLVGLDVRLAIAEHLHRELASEAFRPPDLMRRMVADGKLGKKSGEGFYRWEGE